MYLKLFKSPILILILMIALFSACKPSLVPGRYLETCLDPSTYFEFYADSFLFVFPHDFQIGKGKYLLKGRKLILDFREIKQKELDTSPTIKLINDEIGNAAYKLKLEDDFGQGIPYALYVVKDSFGKVVLDGITSSEGTATINYQFNESDRVQINYPGYSYLNFTPSDFGYKPVIITLKPEYHSFIPDTLWVKEIRLTKDGFIEKKAVRTGAKLDCFYKRENIE